MAASRFLALLVQLLFELVTLSFLSAYQVCSCIPLLPSGPRRGESDNQSEPLEIKVPEAL